LKGRHCNFRVDVGDEVIDFVLLCSFPMLKSEYNMLAIDVEPMVGVLWGSDDEDAQYLIALCAKYCAQCGN
jgi:hypothetical protein